jgi:glycosyltransferase involved in cell wall biosynthesis
MLKAAIDLPFPKTKIRWIPWGIDSGIFHPDSTEKKVTREALELSPDIELVFCPRGISSIYNIDVVVSAIHHLIIQHPKIKLLLLKFNVDSEYLRKLLQYIEKAGIEQHVIWLPTQDTPERMAQLYRAADITISIPDSEGFGVSVYEAMACGCPTIISDLPVFDNDLVHNFNILKVPKSDIQETSSAIYKLLEDKQLQNRLTVNALEIIAKFSLDEQKRHTRDVYFEFLSLHSKNNNA